MKEFQNKNIFFVIPARKNSKGFPFKNRKLLDFTINQIPLEFQQKTIITTDDEQIIERISSLKIKILKRDKKLCLDDTNIRDVMLDVSQKFEMKPQDIIIMLYLTYPNRKFSDIEKIFRHYKIKNATSLLCCSKPKSHPFLCLFKKGGGKGEQIVEHDHYRRQDYPECLEIKHFVCIFQVNEILKLNKNMYNKNTIYYEINDDVDIDYESDFEQFQKK